MGTRVKLLVEPGAIFFPPEEGATGSAAQYVDSVTFMSLDDRCSRVLVLDPGATIYALNSIQKMNWRPSSWLKRGWTIIGEIKKADDTP